jgi:hypothetical protein
VVEVGSDGHNDRLAGVEQGLMTMSNDWNAKERERRETESVSKEKRVFG